MMSDLFVDNTVWATVFESGVTQRYILKLDSNNSRDQLCIGRFIFPLPNIQIIIKDKSTCHLVIGSLGMKIKL